MQERQFPAWLYALSDKELTFVQEFVRNSGSLKAMAQLYDLSYPTLRLRLDRLIDKIEAAESKEVREFEDLLKQLTFEGKLEAEHAQALLRIYERDVQQAE